jgi:hypothetical protein
VAPGPLRLWSTLPPAGARRFPSAPRPRPTDRSSAREPRGSGRGGRRLRGHSRCDTAPGGGRTRGTRGHTWDATGDGAGRSVLRLLSSLNAFSKNWTLWTIKSPHRCEHFDEPLSRSVLRCPRVLLQSTAVTENSRTTTRLKERSSAWEKPNLRPPPGPPGVSEAAVPPRAHPDSYGGAPDNCAILFGGCVSRCLLVVLGFELTALLGRCCTTFCFSLLLPSVSPFCLALEEIPALLDCRGAGSTTVDH